MTKKITLLSFLLFSLFTSAQIIPAGHLTIFSEDGDKFQLILNGELINDVPQTNLRVEDLNQPYYNAKVVFENKTLLEISKNNLVITDVDGVFGDVTYKIKRDKNKIGKMKMNYFSSIPVVQGFIPPANVHVIHYGQPREIIVVNENPRNPVRGNSTQTTTTTTQSGGVNVGVGINVGGINMGVSINDSSDGEVITQTTTTTTSSNNHQDHDNHDNHYQVIPKGCNGNSCMTNGNFNTALSTIKGQNFEDSKLKTAKQVITANCLNVDQIILIANLFNFEDNKLDFAKFAYDYCIEQKNYFKLNGIFNFSSNADELSDYVQSKQ
ncbi:DUF4476 domain-containing protein [Flavobacterium sp.]|uniref:DUF4476 domain-containing protein n=1 Tax=Flavobacterium sp. TaxID=239 RepID=UPI003750874E